MMRGQKYQPSLDDMIFWVIQSEAGDELTGAIDDYVDIEIELTDQERFDLELVAYEHNCSSSDFVRAAALLEAHAVLTEHLLW